ncbi:DUF6099 family protein [Streptomyces sp. HNM0645]|uniref:DUF6099 family protein n=1 Tax=Streptomyces sp. HNM0645 TaxID=2782343 RepID=UPI0024B63F73|nr:DUF6099 family protein [Streptomyces sp. HNM0645]MDI9888121.1 DUF6099 family protein [Streptomyces sp. HNM0645]
MDAERLVAIGRRALAECRTALDVVEEAWQAQALAQAIGGRLAVSGPQELRGEARGLSEAGGRAGMLADPAVLRSGGPRAARLSEVADPGGSLDALGTLLGEVGIALVGVACATDEEGLYWQCIEAIDAADESSDHVRAMLHRLFLCERDWERRRDRDLDHHRERGREGGGAGGRGLAARRPDAAEPTASPP